MGALRLHDAASCAPRAVWITSVMRGIGRLAKSILTAALSCRINHDMHASTQGPCREGDILTLMESEREARRLR